MAVNSFEKISRDVLAGLNPVTGADGRLYLDGTMTNAKLSEAIAEAIYVGEIFRDGQSITKKYTVNARPGDMVRVPLETPFPSSSRTLAIGGREGTEGNGGVINKNAPMLPADDEFAVFMNQVNDQSILFPEMSMGFMPFNTVAKRIAGYAKTVVEDRSASTLAEILAYNIYRAMNGGNNINQIEMDVDGAYGTLLNNLNSALDEGDIITNAHSYSTEGRTIIGRPEFVNKMFNRQSGVILTGSDLAQTMLQDYTFETKLADREYVGNAYKGKTMQFHVQVAASYIWSRAEAYLGLAAGALDGVLAVAVAADATAASDNIDLGVKMIDANEVRGLKAQPLNCWGHEGFRKCQLIGGKTFSTDTLKAAGFDETRRYPKAPKDVFTKANTDQILVPIYALDGVTIVGYQAVANVPKPNGDNVQGGIADVVISVLGTDNAAVKNATVSVTAPSGVTVTNNNDGTYAFRIKQYEEATVSVTAAGYAAQTVKLGKADTKKNIVSKIVTLVKQ